MIKFKVLIFACEYGSKPFSIWHTSYGTCELHKEKKESDGEIRNQ